MKTQHNNQSTPLLASDWNAIEIETGRYFNSAPVTGYEMKFGPLGNPLHGCVDSHFEQELAKRCERARSQKPALTIKRAHFVMPKVNPDRLPSPKDYLLVEQPQSLTSTSVSLICTKQECVESARIGYHFKSNQLADLKDRLAEEKGLDAIIGNLGYFMTKELNVGNHIWSHRRRYADPQFQLPEMLSYLGFFYFGDKQGNIETAGFPSAHDAAIAVDHNNQIHVIPSITFHRFDVNIAGSAFNVEQLNPALTDITSHDIALFNARFPMSHTGPLVEFSPMLELNDRINVFIANRGDGQRPAEEVIKIWHGRCPLPSFGTLLSFTTQRFNQLFPTGLAKGQTVNVTPYANEVELSNYAQILGGLVPSVVNGESIVPTGSSVTAKQAEKALDSIAHTDSPLSRTGKETNNFDAQIREPLGLFIQTETQVGYLLFDGRHEMSIGANIVDVSNLLQRLTDPDIDMFDGERVINAIAIDGGSAMKVYSIEVDDPEQPQMELLNRVAAGGRNAPGNDPQGLNLYSTVIMELKN